MPSPIAAAPPMSHAARARPADAVARPAPSSAVYDAHAAHRSETAPSQGLMVLVIGLVIVRCAEGNAACRGDHAKVSAYRRRAHAAGQPGSRAFTSIFAYSFVIQRPTRLRGGWTLLSPVGRNADREDRWERDGPPAATPVEVLERDPAGRPGEPGCTPPRAPPRRASPPTTRRRTDR